MAKEARNETGKPGLALKQLRRDRHWTLADVGQRTGLSVSTLSKIENGKLSLSYDKIVRLCEGMEVDIACLFTGGHDAKAPSPGGAVGRRIITRAGDGRRIDTDNYRHFYPAADLLNKSFNPIIAEPTARSLVEFGELVRHPGEEWTFVVEGAVEFHSEIYAPSRLEAGDSIYFDSSMGHAYLNASETGRCLVISVCSATEAQLLNSTDGADSGEASSVARIGKGAL